MQKSASDAEVLFPDEEIRIGDEIVLVREFRYLEGLRAAAIARPFLAGLREFVAKREDIDPESLDALIGDHSDVWIQLIGISTGKSIDWLMALSDREGLELSMAFWRVNSAFFTRRLVMGSVVAAKLGGSGSRRSSESSSQPATDETTKTSASA